MMHINSGKYITHINLDEKEKVSLFCSENIALEFRHLKGMNFSLLIDLVSCVNAIFFNSNNLVCYVNAISYKFIQSHMLREPYSVQIC